MRPRAVVTRALSVIRTGPLRGATLVVFTGFVAFVSCAERRGAAPGAGKRPAATASAPTPEPRYLALGDSFTAGTGSAPEHAFPARLVHRWRAQGCPVLLKNVAVNGFTTEDVIADELPAIVAFAPTFVSVAVGANDIVQGRDLASYRVNVRHILDAVTATGARVVVLPQPDWSRSPSAAWFASQEVIASAIARFNALLATEARATRATWIDLGSLMEAQAKDGLLAKDGLHPSAEAYDAWAAELARLLPPPCER